MSIQLSVIGPKGQEVIVDLCDNEEQMKTVTVQHLKKKIVEELSIQGDDIRMVFSTEALEETCLVSSYGIRHMSTIHTLLKLPGGL